MSERAPRELTQRQAEVYQLVACGLTCPDIAESLDLSPRTVQMHVRRIATKLGLDGRPMRAIMLHSARRDLTLR